MGTNRLEMRIDDAAALLRALKEARTSAEPTTINLTPGTYYLPETARIDASLSGLTIRAAEPGSVTLSGGRRLECSWTEHEGGVWMTPVSGGQDP